MRCVLLSVFFFSFRSFVFDLLASLHSHVFLFIHSLSSWLASSHALRHEPSPSLSVMSCPFSLVGRSTRREVDEVRVGASRNGEVRLDAPSFLLLSNRQPPDLCLHLNALPPFPSSMMDLGTGSKIYSLREKSQLAFSSSAASTSSRDTSSPDSCELSLLPVVVMICCDQKGLGGYLKHT